jgi:mRNA-degrading endonuclease RelE of RelBE toxin-antitoxin system
MDKIQKALEKFSFKERKLVKEIIIGLRNSQFAGLNIQKLHGHKGIYRVRKGNLRIIYEQKGINISILAIERKSEKTYRNF